MWASPGTYGCAGAASRGLIDDRGLARQPRRLQGAEVGEDDTVPGDVGLETTLTEIDKLLAVRAVGRPADLFADVAPKVVAGPAAVAGDAVPGAVPAFPRSRSSPDRRLLAA